VHTEGVELAGKLLTREHEQGLQTSAAAAGRKGKAPIREAAAPAAIALLSLPVVDSFLLAAVSVAVSQQQEGSDDDAESVAQSAVQVAGELFKQQLVAVSMGAAGAKLMAAAVASANCVILGASTWGCLVQLYGVLGQWQQVFNIVLAAVRAQLPGVDAGGLQVVLAGAAAALNAAGQHVAAVQLLDGLVAAGVTAVSHASLAQQLVDAADTSSEAEQVRGSDTAQFSNNKPSQRMINFRNASLPQQRQEFARSLYTSACAYACMLRWLRRTVSVHFLFTNRN
jgi:hypothetical protein